MSNTTKLLIRIGFSADLDPAFFVNADPDPDFDPYPGFWWNWKKIQLEKIFF
jgi:hypothetical protein